ncbi:Protein of unknown function [Leuconostoc citreum LBAE C10]|nr:Protein of unknown function [Leuconostoc citreum LBAE C10]
MTKNGNSSSEASVN